MRSVLFRIQAKKSKIKSAKCSIEIKDQSDVSLTSCTIQTPMENGEFVMIETKKSNRSKYKEVAHKCHSNNTDNPSVPCHDGLWELAYTEAQLEGEALLVVMLDVKNKVRIKKYFITVHYHL